ncbi:MAG TPA: hypothetical protein VJ972_13795 [Anaerolineales bacterium]|nr:hypothetical protein [Anaerolineales bacterium]
MEILLAIVVAIAVIFFGALISIGNDRQRRAIDNLREQIVFWATRDLHIKREKLVQDVRVDEPLEWLCSLASRVSGRNLDLDVLRFVEGSNLLVCVDKNNGHKYVFSPNSLKDIKRSQKAGRNRLSRQLSVESEFMLPKNAPAYEMSVFNAGILFDLELAIAWRKITEKGLVGCDVLWMFVI